MCEKTFSARADARRARSTRGDPPVERGGGEAPGGLRLALSRSPARRGADPGPAGILHERVELEVDGVEQERPVTKFS